MIITPLKSEDVEKVAAACIEYAQEIGEPYDADHIRESLTQYSDGRFPIAVAKDEKTGEVLGVSAFICVPHLYRPDVMQARECIWHTSPKLGKFSRSKIQRELLNLMMATCEKNKISLFVSLPENSSMGEVLIDEGFKVKNVLYVKEF